MTEQPTLSVAFAEQSTLPQLQLRDRKGALQCSAYVNAFAVTSQPGWYARPNGNGRSRALASGLWYLSLLGAPGTGTTLQALYGGATENNVSHTLYLEGVGEVALGNQREDLIAQGYATHWNYLQQPVVLAPPVGDGVQQSVETHPKALRGVHGILEPRQMTVADPLRAALSAPRRRARQGKGTHARKQREEAVLSTGSSDAADPETRQQAGDLPCFLLLIPGDKHQDTAFRQQLFLSFLSKRLPWPLKQEWANALWEASCSAGMVEQLTIWSYGMPGLSGNEPIAALPTGHVPVLSASYLCTPQPAFLAQVVERLIAPSRTLAQPAA
jgi:hypothetical protein